MKIITNTPLINRNKRIGQAATIGSLIVLGIGLYISFNPAMISWAFSALLVGFLLSQMGIFYGTRWGRSPRPDEKLTQALKGLGDKFRLYHYRSPVAHLLVGPAGIWVLLPYPQKGVITYDAAKGRWKQTGGNWYMKLFAQESLGRPDQDVKNALQNMENFLKNNLEEGQIPPVNAALVFTDNDVKVQVTDAPYPTLPAEKLKEFIRRKAKEAAFPEEMLKAVIEELPKE